MGMPPPKRAASQPARRTQAPPARLHAQQTGPQTPLSFQDAQTEAAPRLAATTGSGGGPMATGKAQKGPHDLLRLGSSEVSAPRRGSRVGGLAGGLRPSQPPRLV